MLDFQKGEDPGCRIENGKVIEAAAHLNKALELLTFVNNEIVDQAMDSMDVIEKLSAAWDEVNNCRAYTEEIVDLEDLLIPAMGLVNDARLMFESLIYWRLGMTAHGRISILTSIRGAISEGIGPVILKLESCLA